MGVQSLPRTRYGVVHHQHNPVLVRVVLVHQLLHLVRPVHFRPPVRHSGPPPSFQRREQHEKVAHPVALVFIIIGGRRPGSSRPRRPRLPRLPRLLHPRSWPRAGSAACRSRLGRPELRCPHRGAGRLPARLPSRTQSPHCLPAGCTSTLSARACPVAERGLEFVFQRLAHRLGVDALHYLALHQPVRQ